MTEETRNSENIKVTDYCKKIIEPTDDELKNHKIFIKKSFKKSV